MDEILKQLIGHDGVIENPDSIAVRDKGVVACVAWREGEVVHLTEFGRRLGLQLAEKSAGRTKRRS